MASQRLTVPHGDTVLSIKVIDITTIADVPCKRLYTPIVDGLHTFQAAPSLSFLLEHPSGKKYLWDLGVASDLHTLGPQIAERLKAVSYTIKPGDVVDELVAHGVSLESITGVIWSHCHWDHKGDIKKFPGSTELVLGPGSIDYFIKGNGNSALGGVNPRDIEGRQVREPDFKKSNIKIGHFPIVDFFNDGSLYLIDSPGHEVGHLCALVRTTINPPTFVFLGGDAAHHASEFRPSKYKPIPRPILPHPITHSEEQGMDVTKWFNETNEKRGRKPGEQLFTSTLIHNEDDYYNTIDGMQVADAEDNILVIVAHDPSVRSVKNMPFFPDPLNDWQERGLGHTMHWSFVGDIQQALEATGSTGCCA